MQYRLFSTIASLVIAISLISLTQAQTIRTVAIKGQQAPGRPVGDVLKGFYKMSLGSSGHVTFQGYLEEPHPGSYRVPGVWSENETGLSNVIAEGDLLPGLSGGEVAEQIRGYAFNDAGEVAVYLGYSDADWPLTFPQRYGVWSNATGTLAPAAIPGQVVDAAEELTLISAGTTPTGDAQPLVLNAHGSLGFHGSFLTNGVSQPRNNFGLWVLDDDGEFRMAMREGTQPPGTQNGTRFDEFRAPFTLNDHNQIAFGARLISPTEVNWDSRAIFSEGSGTLQMIARTGEQAPGMPEGTLFIGLPVYDNAWPVINNAGHIAFWGGTRKDNERTLSGIWSDRTGSLLPVAIEGSAAPDSDGGVFVIFSHTTSIALNSMDQIAFTASMKEGIGGVDATNNAGIWAGGDELSLIAREGQQAPGMPEGIVFGNSDPTNSYVFEPPTMNAKGQVAFQAKFIRDDGTIYDRGIWAQDLAGELQLIARTGELLEVAPDDFRQIESLYFNATSGNEDGRNTLFNDRGELLFHAIFTDGTDGLFVSNLVAAEALPGDFDNDGDVDGRDFLAWQRGESPNPFSADDLELWQAGSAAGQLAASAGVPEPSAMVLLLATVIPLLQGRAPRCFAARRG